jgi:CRISPR system Cascade subunit CasC
MMIIEIHFIQNFAPSNLNRDDTNNPKDCVFGGVRRARISSQCLKRAIRFEPHFAAVSGVPVSQRTRLMTGEIQNYMEKSGVSAENAKSKAEEFAKHYSSKKAKMDGDKTNVMLFISTSEIKAIGDNLKDLEGEEPIKKFAEDFAKGNANRPGAPDIAMFGRMLADRPETNVDAACQVAHAISTHSVAMDLDFFTAVDDLLKEGETGAGMMGVIGFNSACFYRYATIDVDQLTKNLTGDIAMARNTVAAFLQASTYAIPSGKQNSFAAHNPPSFLMAVVREDGQCWSLANAFEKPVAAYGKESLLQASIKALDTYWGKMNTFFGGQAKVFTALLEDVENLETLKDTRVTTFPAWVEAVISQLPQE